MLLAGCASSRVPRGQREPGANRLAAVLPSGSLRAFIRLTNRGLPAEMMDRIAVALVRECDRNDLDPRVVAALIAHESSFNPRAVSSSGALGLGQLMPGTARWLGVQDSFDPDQNIAGICRYLRTLNERGAKDPDWIIILASYRLGQGTVKRALETTRAIPAVGRDYARDILGRASRITSLT